MNRNILSSDADSLSIFTHHHLLGPFRTAFFDSISTPEHKSDLPEYQKCVERVNTFNKYGATAPGCPHRAALAMWQVTELENPPVHLPLGKFAYDAARAKLKKLLEEIDEYEHIGLPTDMTEEELKAK